MASCARCGKLATDPARGPSDWTVAVVEGEQQLACPDCRAELLERAETCPKCGSKRLRKALGDRMCRACAHQWSEDTFTLD